MTFLGPVNNYPEGTSPFSRQFREVFEEMAAIAYWVEENRHELERAITEVHPTQGRGASTGILHVLTQGPPIDIATNRWEYNWFGAILDPTTRDWILNPAEGAPNSLTPPFRPARNKVEQLNTTTVAAHGLDITGTADFTAEVVPIPNLTPVTLFFSGTVTIGEEDFLQHYFSEVNAVNFICTGGLLSPEGPVAGAG